VLARARPETLMATAAANAIAKKSGELPLLTDGVFGPRP